MPSKEVFEKKDGAVYTTSTGAPIAEPYAAQRLGNLGPLLLQGNASPEVQDMMNARVDP